MKTIRVIAYENEYDRDLGINGKVIGKATNADAFKRVTKSEQATGKFLGYVDENGEQHMYDEALVHVGGKPYANQKAQY